MKQNNELTSIVGHYSLFCFLTVNRVHFFSRGFSSFKELKGLCYKAFVVNQRISNFTSTGFGKAVCFSLKADDRFTAVPRSSESDILLGESAVVEQDNATVNSMVQEDAVALGTMTADMASVPDDFSIDNDENDLDCPTEGFSCISEAIKDIRQGKVCFD